MIGTWITRPFQRPLSIEPNLARAGKEEKTLKNESKEPIREMCKAGFSLKRKVDKYHPEHASIVLTLAKSSYLSLIPSYFLLDFLTDKKIVYPIILSRRFCNGRISMVPL